MNANKKYFLFPKPRLNHLLYLFYFISSLVKQYNLKVLKDKEKNLSIPIFKLYVYEISDFLSIIPYQIIKKKQSLRIFQNQLIMIITKKMI